MILRVCLIDAHGKASKRYIYCSALILSQVKGIIFSFVRRLQVFFVVEYLICIYIYIDRGRIDIYQF